MVNGLACFSLRGEPQPTGSASEWRERIRFAQVCQCDFVYPLPNSKLHSALGSISWERQQQIKSRLKKF